MLKRGAFEDKALWPWLSQVEEGRVERKNVSIRVMNAAGVPIVGWHLRNAWPVRWKGLTLNADANEAAIETLEICHEGIRIERFSKNRNGWGK